MEKLLAIFLLKFHWYFIEHDGNMFCEIMSCTNKSMPIHYVLRKEEADLKAVQETGWISTGLCEDLKPKMEAVLHNSLL